MSDNIIIGYEPEASAHYSQVYQATHDGAGLRLPLMKRSFISFSFGGKYIEDFNLIATTSGDRMSRDGYSSFDDITSSYDALEGQKYWNTHYKTNTYNFSLATDGIDQRQLDDFLHWFSAGVCRELILAEHPNRAQLARVSSPPQLHLLPFESNVQVNISGTKYTTKTTLYKGEIELQMVMDSPHWYSVTNIIGELDGNRYIDKWIDANGNEVNIFASQDALKIIYEDGIPVGSMIQSNMLLGNGSYANVEGQNISRIWWPQQYDEDIVWVNGKPTCPKANGDPGEEDVDYYGARIDSGDRKTGIIAGAIISATGEGIEALPTYDPSNPTQNCGYFYYSGNAPAPTIIKFTMTPIIDGTTGYVTCPFNSKTTTKYNTITIESKHKQELKLTTPNILTSFNKAIDIFNTYVNANYSWETVREHIRDEVRHAGAREWAMYKVNLKAANTEISANGVITALKNDMARLISNAQGQVQSMTFTFNSENGEAVGEYSYSTPNDPENFQLFEEDVGDMLRSNYIVIRERNHPNDETGYIVNWESNNENTKTYSHRIYHDFPVALTNLSVLYKNMYL